MSVKTLAIPKRDEEEDDDESTAEKYVTNSFLSIACFALLGISLIH